MIWWGTSDAPAPPHVVSPGHPTPITVAVSPVRPGHAVTVEYRANGGPIRQAMALPLPGAHTTNERLFRALLPGQPSGLVDFLPVLRFAGQPISPGLAESTDYPRYQVGGGAAPGTTASAPPRATAGSSATPGAELAGKPRWDWNTRLLWTSSIGIRKEVIGRSLMVCASTGISQRDASSGRITRASYCPGAAISCASARTASASSMY